MPTYLYECGKCHHEFGVIKTLLLLDSPEHCPVCKTRAKRVITRVNLTGSNKEKGEDQVAEFVLAEHTGYKSQTHYEVEMEKRSKIAAQKGIPEQLALSAKSPFGSTAVPPTVAEIKQHKKLTEAYVNAHLTKKFDKAFDTKKKLNRLETQVKNRKKKL